MDMNDAITGLGALAQEGRLRVFRLLMAYGPEGLPAGEVARRLDVAHNTLSSQFAVLSQAGLLQSRRNGRSIIYSVDLAGPGLLPGTAGRVRPAAGRRNPDMLPTSGGHP